MCNWHCTLIQPLAAIWINQSTTKRTADITSYKTPSKIHVHLFREKAESVVIWARTRGQRAFRTSDYGRRHSGSRQRVCVPHDRNNLSTQHIYCVFFIEKATHRPHELLNFWRRSMALATGATLKLKRHFINRFSVRSFAVHDAFTTGSTIIQTLWRRSRAHCALNTSQQPKTNRQRQCAIAPVFARSRLSCPFITLSSVEAAAAALMTPAAACGDLSRVRRLPPEARCCNGWSHTGRKCETVSLRTWVLVVKSAAKIPRAHAHIPMSFLSS